MQGIDKIKFYRFIYFKICDKILNGSKEFEVHNKSKAHKSKKKRKNATRSPVELQST